MEKCYFAVVVLCLMMIFTAAAQTSEEPRKFDEFGNICCNNVKAKLDKFATEILKDPKARGYIVFYEGRRYSSCNDSLLKLPRQKEGFDRAARLVSYMYDTHPTIDGIPVALIDGGFRENWTAELWIARNWKKMPKVTPTLDAKDIKYRRGRMPRIEYKCMMSVRPTAARRRRTVQDNIALNLTRTRRPHFECVTHGRIITTVKHLGFKCGIVTPMFW